MSNDMLAAAGNAEAPTETEADQPLANPPALPEDFLAAMKTAGYIRAIQLVQRGSKVATEYNPAVNGPIEPREGMFWFDKDVLLGTYDKNSRSGEFVGMPLAMQPHALLLKNGSPEKESFDFKDPVFTEIRLMRKSQDGNVRPMWGVDVLFWLPDIREFGVYFLHSSARDASQSYAPVMNQFCCTVAAPAKNKYGSWKVPSVMRVGDPDRYELPPEDLKQQFLAKFGERTARGDDPVQAQPGGGVDR